MKQSVSRSVYGAEIAGGFTGLMEAADTASAGSLSLLWGLVKADNLLGALSIVYPTEGKYGGVWTACQDGLIVLEFLGTVRWKIWRLWK
ncbi:MAG: hypothetical protein ACLUD0_05830 [Eubacterium ramulus]